MRSLLADQVAIQVRIEPPGVSWTPRAPCLLEHPALWSILALEHPGLLEHPASWSIMASWNILEHPGLLKYPGPSVSLFPQYLSTSFLNQCAFLSIREERRKRKGLWPPTQPLHCSEGTARSLTLSMANTPRPSPAYLASQHPHRSLFHPPWVSDAILAVGEGIAGGCLC